MQNLIKEIRAYLNMSQTEFAELLNVSFATVNRWENGRAVPNKLAQSKMYDLCRERSVPVYDMTLKKIAKAAESVKLQKGRILLYHGSKSGIEGDIAESFIWEPTPVRDSRLFAIMKNRNFILFRLI